jgi:hypothetical protein
LFASTKGGLRCLPPTEDAFKQHLLRAANQIAISKSATLSRPQLPNPLLYGRKLQNGKLVPIMMTKSPKPKVLTKSVPYFVNVGEASAFETVHVLSQKSNLQFLVYVELFQTHVIELTEMW